MGVVTFAWWGLFAFCLIGLVWSRGRKRAASAATAADGDTETEEQPAGPRLPAALRAPDAPASRRRPTFSSFDREILAPLLLAEVGPDGVRCPGCVDGSVRRYLHRSIRSTDEVKGDVWCASCRRHTTLDGAGDGIDFDDPLAHLDDVRRDEIVRDLDEYLGGLDVLWAQGKLPQQIRRGGTVT